MEIFEYIAGAEVSSFGRCLKGLRSVRLAAEKYAVFSLPDHISTIRGAVHNIWTKWILDAADVPDFERYGSEFDSTTGMVGFEIWVPLVA